jgi:hypothetical protein
MEDPTLGEAEPRWQSANGGGDFEMAAVLRLEVPC